MIPRRKFVRTAAGLLIPFSALAQAQEYLVNRRKYFRISSNDITDSMVGWWKMNEGSGNASDYSGNSNTGTLQSGATWNNDATKGNCVSFASGGVTIGNVAVLRLTGTTVTISAWVLSNTNAGARAIFHNGTNGASCESYGLQVGIVGCSSGASTKASASVIRGAIVNANSPSAATTGSWVHYCGVYNGSTIRLFINGSQVASSAASADINSSANQYVTIGADLSGAGRYFWDGKIRDVRVYSRALTDAEILIISGINV